MLKLFLYYINQMYLNNLENIMNLLSMFYTSHEYLVWVEIFFQCVSLIELNPWEGE
jgi:hypothetical protein